MKAAKTEKEFIAAMKEISTTDLLEWYNERTGKNTSKFASREKGEVQCLRVFKESRQGDRREDDERRAGDRRVGASPRSLFEGGGEEPAPIAAQPQKAELAACPSCAHQGEITAAGKVGTKAGKRFFCHRCGTEFTANGTIYKKPAGSRSRSEAIARTWQSPEVADKRAERTAVQVGEQEFRSVKQAFERLGLPLAKHIPFRIKLKAEGAAEFEHNSKKFKFVAIEGAAG